MVNYVFDVDGTLTPSRLKMDPGFREFFKAWMRYKNVYLLTGSDAPKTIEQVGRDVWSSVVAYQCSGNDIYAFGKKVYELPWPTQRDLDYFLPVLENQWKFSKYPHKLGADGNHIEIRKGLINFSTVGRNCTQERREDYYEWDKKNNERRMLVDYVQTFFQGVSASIGGQISIDIYPPGKDKGQILEFLESTGEPIYFFGDKTEEGGNDYPLASRLKDPHKVFQVSGPEETMSILKGLK